MSSSQIVTRWRELHFERNLRVGVVALISSLSACAGGDLENKELEAEVTETVLFDASAVLQHSWRHLPIRGKTQYSLAAGDGGVVVKAEGKNSASGLIRSVNIDTRNCSTLKWRWRVDALQTTANLRNKKQEDVAASLFLLFGDPGFMTSPEPVPTLRYVWTNDKHQKDEVIESPYLPGVVRSIVVRSGERGTWFTETRNINLDYERAFEGKPADSIHAIALFTDNDQTKERTIAYYSWARIVCTAPTRS